MPDRRNSLFGRSPWRDAAVIALAYLALATTWILWSDSVVAALAGNDAALLDRLQSFKGLFFVAGTAAALYVGVALVLRTRARLLAERHQMQQLLNAQSKFEALGQLAGSLAHDFNNVLLVIQGAASLAESGENPHEMLGTIQRSAEQAERAIASLMLFVRQQPNAFVRFDLVAHLAEIEPLLRQALGKRVTFERVLPTEPVPVVGVPGLLTQAFLNLTTNARDALAARPDARVLLHLTPRTLAGHRSVFRAAPASGPHAVISVTDNGCGIPPENLAAIFTPLFTTKPAGKGTGLGLSSALHAVQQHGGWIEVDSKPGSGTTFRLYVPIAPDEAPPAGGAPAGAAALSETPAPERGTRA